MNDPNTRQPLALADEIESEAHFEPTAPLMDRPPAADAGRTLDYEDRDRHLGDADEGRDLGKRTLQGGAWQLGSYAIQNVVRFGSNIVLARLLTRDDFGLAAFTTVVLVGLEQFSDVGVAPSIVQNKKGETEPFLRTAFTIQLLRGAVLTVVGLALAIPMAKYTGHPIVAGLVAVAVCNSFVGGLRSTAWARLQRRVRLAELSVIQTVIAVVSTLGVIVWAWVAPSAWALVVPSLLGTIVSVAVSHFLLRDRRDRLGWDPESARMLFGFGSWVFVSTALTFCANSADRFLFAGLVDMGELGVYNIALSLATMSTLVLLRLGMSVVFPALATVKDDPERFARVFKKVRLPMVLFAGYAAAGLIGSGRFFMGAVYPPQYAAAGWMVQILAVVGWLQVLQAPNDSALLAVGRSKLVAVAHAFKFVALMAGMYFGLRWHGLAGAVFGVAFAEVVRYVVDTIMVTRINLRNFAGDGLFALWIAGSAAAGWYAGKLCGNDWAALFVSAAVVTVLWLPAMRPVLTWLKNRKKMPAV